MGHVYLRNVNRTIQREHHVMPTFEEVCDDLQSACFFCKANMHYGYFQIELDENSRNLTCFSTHEFIHRFYPIWTGLFARLKRLRGGGQNGPHPNLAI